MAHSPQYIPELRYLIQKEFVQYRFPQSDNALKNKSHLILQPTKYKYQKIPFWSMWTSAVLKHHEL